MTDDAEHILAPEPVPDGPGLFGDLPEARAPASQAYRVLARKYRPQTFDALVGQEAMVRTLGNAFETGRIAHAFVLTGVRGIGKTTTARIIARALNCIGADGKATKPTIAPCGVCVHCTAIADSRHMDVMEMDAASRTGIGDIREIIDSVAYAPSSARYKVYIIDEVHMLSTAAFNGLLKTLEEPPAHVKFIFATTEIRKIPVTVLSRCQRFDLRRLDTERMATHLGDIAAQEEITVDPGAMGLIARAADGSVRDGLSLLDQAIAHAGSHIDEATVRDMLGLADRARIFDLYELIMKGEVAGALAELRAQYDAGADPQTTVRDLLELTHLLTRMKLVPNAARDPSLPETERTVGVGMAEKLSTATLTRAWQMLLKGLYEVRDAPQPIAAAEMLLVRLCFAADLPTPADLVKRLQDQPAGSAPRQTPPTGGGGGAGPMGSAMAAAASGNGAGARPQSMPQPAARAAPAPATATALAPREITDFDALVALAGEYRDIQLKQALETHVRLVHFEPGRIEFNPAPNAAPGLAAAIAQRLSEWTGERWLVTLSNAPAAPTLAERKKDARQKLLDEVRGHPLVQAVMTAFPKAEIADIRDTAALAAEQVPPAAAATPDDDIFYDDADPMGEDGP